MSEQGFQIPFSMRNAKNLHFLILDRINDDVFAHRKTARTNAEVIFTAATQIGVAGKKEKPVSNGINHLVGNLDVAALCRDVVPDAIEIGGRLRGNAVRH